MRFLCILNNHFNVIFITKYALITVDINQGVCNGKAVSFISQIAHSNAEQQLFAYSISVALIFSVKQIATFSICSCSTLNLNVIRQLNFVQEGKLICITSYLIFLCVCTYVALSELENKLALIFLGFKCDFLLDFSLEKYCSLSLVVQYL